MKNYNNFKIFVCALLWIFPMMGMKALAETMAARPGEDAEKDALFAARYAQKSISGEFHSDMTGLLGFLAQEEPERIPEAFLDSLTAPIPVTVAGALPVAQALAVGQKRERTPEDGEERVVEKRRRMLIKKGPETELWCQCVCRHETHTISERGEHRMQCFEFKKNQFCGILLNWLKGRISKDKWHKNFLIKSDADFRIHAQKYRDQILAEFDVDVPEQREVFDELIDAALG